MQNGKKNGRRNFATCVPPRGIRLRDHRTLDERLQGVIKKKDFFCDRLIFKIKKNEMPLFSSVITSVPL